jgi:cell division protein FtsZ
VYNITGGRDLTLSEVNRVSEVVTSLADPAANVIFGAVVDDRWGGEALGVGAWKKGGESAAQLQLQYKPESQHRTTDYIHPPPHQRYEGELHVTIIATGFAESYEEQLLSGGAAAAAARRGTGAAAAGGSPAPGAGQQGAPGGGAQAGGPWNKPERASRPYLGRTVF